jgi:hypothetical protein
MPQPFVKYLFALWPNYDRFFSQTPPNPSFNIFFSLWPNYDRFFSETPRALLSTSFFLFGEAMSIKNVSSDAWVKEADESLAI